MWAMDDRGRSWGWAAVEAERVMELRTGRRVWETSSVADRPERLIFMLSLAERLLARLLGRHGLPRPTDVTTLVPRGEPFGETGDGIPDLLWLRPDVFE